MSDTPRTDEFARAECCDLQHALDFARELEREIEDWKDKLDGSEITHAATRADLRDCKRELDQERQDRKQADLDTIRALGERNDARKLAADWQMLADLAEQKLQQELQLADRLAETMRQVADGCNDAWCRDDATVALAAWKAARNEAVNPP